MAGRAWPQEETDRLRALWAQGGWQDYSHFAEATAPGLGRTPNAVRLKAAMLFGGDAPPPAVTDELDHALLETIRALGQQTVEQLADHHNVAPRVIRETVERLRAGGHTIAEHETGVQFERTSVEWHKTYLHELYGNEFLFGVVSDTHWCSNYCHTEGVAALYAFFGKEGAQKAYHAGDVVAGEKMYRGQEYEIACAGVDNQAARVVAEYPADVETDFIIGNHDACYYRRSQADIGIRIAAGRPDMHYLGPQRATITLGEGGPSVMLFHPDGGTAYALSYHPQRMVAALTGGEKPALLIVGHYHKAEFIPHIRNVAVLQAGTLEWQTPFMRGRSIDAHVGGWLVSGRVGSDGSITRLRAEFVPFYKEAA